MHEPTIIVLMFAALGGVSPGGTAGYAMRAGDAYATPLEDVGESDGGLRVGGQS